MRLASATIAVPEIYFDSQGSNKVDCNRETNDETVLKCDLNDTIVTQEETEVYYKSRCGGYISTGITVKKIADSKKIIHLTGMREVDDENNFFSFFNIFYIDLGSEVESDLRQNQSIEIVVKSKETFHKLLFIGIVRNNIPKAIDSGFSGGSIENGHYYLSSIVMKKDESFYFDLVTQIDNNKQSARLINGDLTKSLLSYDNVMTPILNRLHKKRHLEFTSES